MATMFEPTDLPKADEMERKAHLYQMMADDLRAQAAKMRLDAKYPGRWKNKAAEKSLASPGG